MTENTKGSGPVAKPARAEKVTLPRSVVADKVRLSDPGHIKADNIILSDVELSFLNASIRDLRSLDPHVAIRALTRFNGIFSTAVASYIEVAMSGYLVTAFKAGTNEFDPVGTAAAQAIMASADTLYDYTTGYADKPSIEGLLSTQLKECITMGGCSQELVLNRYWLPEKIVPVPITSLKWTTRTDGTVYPKQITYNAFNVGGTKTIANVPASANPVGSGGLIVGGYVDLDIPTFFYAPVEQPANTVFARSPLEAALQMMFVFQEFLEDMLSVLRKAGHNRVVVSIMSEAVQDMATKDIKSDPTKLFAFMERVRADIQDVVSSLEPDEALVTYDTAKVEALRTSGEKADYTAFLQMLGTLMASALKAMPSVLGLGQGSQNLATAEALVFLKMVRSIQVPVEVVMSRSITLAVRLVSGSDCYVNFKFDPINIRPADELSAHNSVNFQMLLQKLSLGLISDDYFAHLARMGPRPAGAPKLSGTMFLNPDPTQPKDMNLNTGGQARNLNEGTSQGSPNSQGGGKPA